MTTDLACGPGGIVRVCSIDKHFDAVIVPRGSIPRAGFGAIGEGLVVSDPHRDVEIGVVVTGVDIERQVVDILRDRTEPHDAGGDAVQGQRLGPNTPPISAEPACTFPFGSVDRAIDGGWGGKR